MSVTPTSNLSSSIKRGVGTVRQVRVFTKSESRVARNEPRARNSGRATRRLQVFLPIPIPCTRGVQEMGVSRKIYQTPGLSVL